MSRAHNFSKDIGTSAFQANISHPRALSFLNLNSAAKKQTLADEPSEDVLTLKLEFDALLINLSVLSNNRLRGTT